MIPTWQQGFDIDRLKALARPFKMQHRRLVFGGFGLTKERDVAAALARQDCVWSASSGGIEATALFHRLKRTGRVTDFAQRTVQIPEESLYVDAFAALSEQSAIATLLGLKTRAEPAALWVEIFEEDETAKRAVLAAGLVYVASKIMAGGEVKGVYASTHNSTTLDSVEEATLSVLRPDFLYPHELDSIMLELEAAAPFAQHYSNYNKRGSWEAFALRGYRSEDPEFIIKPAEMSRAWKVAHHEDLRLSCADTKVASGFPTVKAVCARIAPSLDRVRFMRLRAGGGELTRHADITDRQAGVRDGRIIRLHIPIVTNPQVLFSAWTARGERLDVRFPVGALCYLDQRKPHTAINPGSTDRIHLVVDAFAHEELRALIRDAS